MATSLSLPARRLARTAGRQSPALLLCGKLQMFRGRRLCWLRWAKQANFAYCPIRRKAAVGLGIDRHKMPACKGANLWTHKPLLSS
jgi:hypothetical protein